MEMGIEEMRIDPVTEEEEGGGGIVVVDRDGCDDVRIGGDGG